MMNISAPTPANTSATCGGLLGSRARASARCFDGLVALDPVSPVRGVLLLPDRHRLLEPVDAPLARGDRFRAVRRGDRDHHRCLADLEAPCAMGHRHAR